MVLQFTASPFILTNRQLLLGGNIINLVIPQQSTTQRKKHDLLKVVSTEHFSGTQEGRQLLGVHSCNAVIFHIHSLQQCSICSDHQPRTQTQQLNIAQGPLSFCKGKPTILNQDKQIFFSHFFKQQAFLPSCNYSINARSNHPRSNTVLGQTNRKSRLLTLTQVI